MCQPYLGHRTTEHWKLEVSTVNRRVKGKLSQLFQSEFDFARVYQQGTWAQTRTTPLRWEKFCSIGLPRLRDRGRTAASFVSLLRKSNAREAHWNAYRHDEAALHCPREIKQNVITSPICAWFSVWANLSAIGPLFPIHRAPSRPNHVQNTYNTCTRMYRS